MYFMFPWQLNINTHSYIVHCGWWSTYSPLLRGHHSTYPSKAWSDHSLPAPWRWVCPCSLRRPWWQTPRSAGGCLLALPPKLTVESIFPLHWIPDRAQRILAWVLEQVYNTTFDSTADTIIEGEHLDFSKSILLILETSSIKFIEFIH